MAWRMAWRISGWSDNVQKPSESADGDEVDEDGSHIAVTSIKEQGPDDTEVESPESISCDVIDKVRVLAEALPELRFR